MRKRSRRSGKVQGMALCDYWSRQPRNAETNLYASILQHLTNIRHNAITRHISTTLNKFGCRPTEMTTIATQALVHPRRSGSEVGGRPARRSGGYATRASRVEDMRDGDPRTTPPPPAGTMCRGWGTHGADQPTYKPHHSPYEKCHACSPLLMNDARL